jgi:hypothetical protein
MTEFENRKIICMVGLRGGEGKTILVEHAEYLKLGYQIPPYDSLKDIMGEVMVAKHRKCFLIDMPRRAAHVHVCMCNTNVL